MNYNVLFKEIAEVKSSASACVHIHPHIYIKLHIAFLKSYVFCILYIYVKKFVHTELCS